MPELVNWTPFPNFRYYNSDNKGKEFGAIIVKATFDIAEDGTLTASEEQAPMVFTDKCHGAVNTSSLWHPSDLVARKASTDIIVNAIARAPDGKPSSSWTCGLSVKGEDFHLDKFIRVTGPRQWQPHWQRELSANERENWQKYRDLFEKWFLSESAAITELPIHYEYAFGDLRQSGINEDGQPIFDDYGYNPLGCGWLHPEMSDHTIAHPVAQIEAIDEPILDPYKLYTPQGLGPIPAAWEPRLPKAGTYDDNWLENIWPNWPPDYQFAYNNSAQPDLIMPHFFNGDEKIKLQGLRPKGIDQTIQLPSLKPQVVFTDAGGNRTHSDMQLDTVFLDVAAPALNDCHVFLSWRVNFEPDRFEKATIVMREATAAQAPIQEQNYEGVSA